MTARQIDTNGWTEVKGNPISKAGVFQYLGSELPQSLNLEPGKLYSVYRSKEELEKKEAIESFKLLPWTDDHPEKLLGKTSEGFVSPTDKGICGVTGQDIYVEGEYLKANLKVYSEDLAEQIEQGKKDLSLGYKADYILQDGVYNGQSYQVVQVNLLGNHISSVDEGRSGRDVSVLDKKHNEVFDMNEEKEKDSMDEGEEQAMLTLPMIAGQMKELKDYVTDALSKLMNVEAAEAAEVADEDEYKEEDKDAMDEDKEEKEEEKESMDGDKEDEDKKAAMDAVALKKSVFAEISQRDKLSSKLAKHVGVFDSAEMTFDEVAKYGVKKLGLSCAKGQESVLIEGYLAGKSASASFRAAAAMDKTIKSKKVDAYLRGDK